MDAKKETILIIDDESLIRDSFRYYFEDYDYRVLEAENGRAGLEMIRKNNPDLVLLDLRMPEMSGLEVFEQLRRDTPHLPVIVISGSGFAGDVSEAMKCGASNYLLKPVVNFNVVRYAVKQALDERRLHSSFHTLPDENG